MLSNALVCHRWKLQSLLVLLPLLFLFSCRFNCVGGPTTIIVDEASHHPLNHQIILAIMYHVHSWVTTILLCILLYTHVVTFVARFWIYDRLLLHYVSFSYMARQSLQLLLLSLTFFTLNLVSFPMSTDAAKDASQQGQQDQEHRGQALVAPPLP